MFYVKQFTINSRYDIKLITFGTHSPYGISLYGDILLSSDQNKIDLYLYIREILFYNIYCIKEQREESESEIFSRRI